MPEVAQTPVPMVHHGRTSEHIWFDDNALAWASREGKYVKLDDSAPEVAREGKYVTVEMPD